MSETPQQHGWQPPDSEEPADQTQRGFGLFEAPAAPDEFPVFTPYSQVVEAQTPEDFPPDSVADDNPPNAFPGFPSEESAYVPAPAAMPIPGVAHDAFAPETPQPRPKPEVPEVPAVPEAPASGSEISGAPGGSAGSWSAFAAGDAPKPPSTPAPWTAAESLSPTQEPPSYPGFEPSPAPVASHQLFAADPVPPADSMDQAQGVPDPASVVFQPAEPNPAPAQAPVFPWPEPSPVPAEAAPPAVFQQPEPSPVPAEAVPPAVFHQPEPSPVPAEAAPPAVFHQPEPSSVPAPTAPPALEENQPAVVARAAAVAPVANRVSPSEIPATLPKPAGRVYGSAAASAPVSPPAPMEAPPAEVAPVQTLTPEPATAPIRATARPVHLVQPDPSEVIPAQRSSTIYGSPANSAAPPQAPPPPAATGLAARGHAFGDLLPQSAGTSPQPPAAPAVPAQRAPQPPAQQPTSATAQGGLYSAASSMPPRDSEQSRFDHFAQQQPARISDAPIEPKPERKGRLIVSVLAGCAALLTVAFGGLILIDKLVSSPTFKIGDCVKQVGEDGVEKASCAEAGVFHIVSSVASQAECDQTQPFVQQEDRVFCLEPASSNDNQPSPPAQPTGPTQSP